MVKFRIVLLFALAIFQIACSSRSSKKNWTHQSVPGKTAIIIDGKAVPPANLPSPVLSAVAAGNRIAGKPYRMGGGHKDFEDRCYDCSGTVSYLLHHAGHLDAPTTSTALRNFGKKGEGKWITVYAKKGHTFIEVAGLRMDTGYNGEGKGPRWSTRDRPTKGYVARHPVGL
jgi:hypothetical protein